MTLSIKSSLFSGKTLRDNLYFLINVQLSAQRNLDLVTLNLVPSRFSDTKSSGNLLLHWYLVVIFELLTAQC